LAVSILGLGYVGMTLSLKLAEAGQNVFGVDCNESIVRTLMQGRVHLSEPGLQELLGKHLGKRFFPSTRLPPHHHGSSYVICVNTPVDSVGRIDLSPLTAAASDVGRSLREGDLVAVRSTVPPGTTRRMVVPTLESCSGLQAGRDFGVCVAPERTVEGKALAELGRLPQIIGGFDASSAEAGQALFRSVTPDTRVVSSMEAAEMVKLLDNCYRYAVFAIGNEFGLACEALGLDAAEVIEAANWHYPRNDIKMPGAGVGGGCLPKDARMMIDAMKRSGVSPTLLRAARKVNEGMPRRIFEIVDGFHAANRIPKNRSKILILGFAFKGKPQVNDTRHSPGGYLSRLLRKSGYNVCGYDPAVSEDQIRSFGAEPCEVQEGFMQATAAVAMNDNPTFADLDLAKLSRRMSSPCLIVDGWRILDDSRLGAREGVIFRRLGNGRTRGP